MRECGACTYLCIQCISKVSRIVFWYVLYVRVSCVCLSLSDEPVLFVFMSVEMLNCSCLDGPREDKL